MTDHDFFTVRLWPSGEPDLSLGGSGQVITDLPSGIGEGNAVAVQADGRLLVAGAANLRGVVVRQLATTGVASFGWNAVGQLGTGTNTDSHSAMAAPALYGSTAVSSGAYHSLALKGDGSVWGWGWNGAGQLGDGSTFDRWSPVPVPGLPGISAVAAGQYHSLAVVHTGAVYAWGWNGAGQLGIGNTIDFHIPVPVNLTSVVAVAAGYHHSLALKADGTVWAWGWNIAGQLGDGSNVDRWSPVQVSGLTGVKSISAGAYHSLAVLADGTVGPGAGTPSASWGTAPRSTGGRPCPYPASRA